MSDRSGPKLVAPDVSHPEVTIVVPTIRNPGRLRRCLEAVLHSVVAEGLAFELLLVLDGAEPDVGDFVTTEVQGATVLSWPERRGLAAGLNAACREARTPYVAVIQDDAVPRAGWLGPLLATARSQPRAGIVGSVSLRPDGTVLIAGAFVLGDGSTSMPWPGEPPPLSALVGVRAVDYAAGTAYVVDRAAWSDVGGWDEALYPAIFVDADFCTALWQAGRLVLVDPRSVVVHDLHGSTERPFREFVHGRNHTRFAQKWSAVFAGRPQRPLTAEAIRAFEDRLAGWLNDPPSDLSLHHPRGAPAESPPIVHVGRERDLLRDYSAHLECLLDQPASLLPAPDR